MIDWVGGWVGGWLIDWLIEYWDKKWQRKERRGREGKRRKEKERKGKGRKEKRREEKKRKEKKRKEKKEINWEAILCQKLSRLKKCGIVHDLRPFMWWCSVKPPYGWVKIGVVKDERAGRINLL